MPVNVKNKNVYLAVHLKSTPEDRNLALKMLRQFGDDSGAPKDFDFGRLADEITESGDWIIKHTESGMLSFITEDSYERDFEVA